MNAAPARSREVADLDDEAERLWSRRAELQEVRSRNIRLQTALQQLERDPCEKTRRAAEEALAAYQESPAVKRIATVALTLSLAACNSIGSQIRALNDEEREVTTHIEQLQAVRKANIHLVTALQALDRSETPKTEAAVAKARAEYEDAKRRCD